MFVSVNRMLPPAIQPTNSLVTRCNHNVFIELYQLESCLWYLYAQTGAPAQRTVFFYVYSGSEFTLLNASVFVFLVYHLRSLLTVF